VKLFACAAAIMLAGLALLLAMVVRVIEPALSLSLVGYASFFVGMLLVLTGAVRRSGTRR
jgi:hypothetical protein